MIKRFVVIDTASATGARVWADCKQKVEKVAEGVYLLSSVQIIGPVTGSRLESMDSCELCRHSSTSDQSAHPTTYTTRDLISSDTVH